MASQVAHIIYAQKYFEKHPMPNGDEDLFILGCVFPDIRRIDETIKRKDTHLCYEVCDLNFEGLPPFRAGWKFHLYCDMKREEILNKYAFYDLPNTTDFWHQPAKMLEDEAVYDSNNNWEKLVHYFNNAPDFDAGINVSREIFSLWYAITAKYIEKKPDSKSMRIFLSKQPSFAKKTDTETGTRADLIVDTVDKLRKNGKIVEILKKVAEEIV